MTVLIVGSGRSGTSLNAMILEALGLDVGNREQMRPATDLNPQGYFENVPLLDFIGERISPLFPSGPFTKNAFGRGWQTRPGVPELLADGRALWQSLKTSDSMLFKFFEVGYHLPLWREIIDDEIVFVVAFRDPYEVTTSYQSVASFFSRRPDSVAYRLFRWSTLYQRLLNEIEGSKAFFVEYGQLLAEPERVITDLADTLVAWGIVPGPVDTSAALSLVEPTLYRSGRTRPLPSATLRPRTKGMYESLQRLSGRHDSFHWADRVSDGRDLFSILLIRSRMALRPVRGVFRRTVASLKTGGE